MTPNAQMNMLHVKLSIVQWSSANLHSTAVVAQRCSSLSAALVCLQIRRVQGNGRAAVSDCFCVLPKRRHGGRMIAVQHSLQLRLIWLRRC
jgi:hypothetical protein